MSPARKRSSIVVIGLALGIAVMAVLVARPYVTHRFAVRSAYSRLSRIESAEREDALRWLLRNGEDPDAALLKMLESPSEQLRCFAADKLVKRPVKPEIATTFIRLLQDDEYLQRFESSRFREDFQRDAIRALGMHAESATEAVTAIDEQIIALLQPMLSDANTLNSEAAMVLAEYAPRRPELRELLQAYATGGYLYGGMKVARGLYRSDPARLGAYLELLVAGVASGNPFERERAMQYLHELAPAAGEAIARLNARREASTDAGEIARIDEVLESLGPMDSEQR